MANHKSSLKRIRQDQKKRLQNRYYGRTMRNSVRAIRLVTDKKEAEAMFPKVAKMVDKLAKKNFIHWKKAANLKSKIAKHINSL